MPKNAIYAQSGGVTAVINAQAAAVIETVNKHPDKINKLYAGLNGIVGILHEELIDLSQEDPENLENFIHTPGGAFGSCRYKLKGIEQNKSEYQRLLDVFKAHDIGYFFYNGGNDSQDTTNKIAQFCKMHNYPITCIGIPKTIDNDLAETDNCPGFGSVAKYVAVSILEAGLDVIAMSASSTKVFIMEVMGRHTGWIAAASGLAANSEEQAPHIILFPEITFDADKFCRKVEECVDKYGYCAVVAAEGIKDSTGKFIAAADSTDMFGHAQLGGVAAKLAALVQNRLKLKNHYAICDYLQRSARHICSQTDLDHAYATGKAAVEYAVAGKNAVMPIIKRTSNNPYAWEIDYAKLEDVANTEKFLPKEYISCDGFNISDDCRKYLSPLIAGEAYPDYKNGIPNYVRLSKILVDKKLKTFR